MQQLTSNEKVLTMENQKEKSRLEKIIDKLERVAMNDRIFKVMIAGYVIDALYSISDKLGDK
jgi:hypothetical protein